MAKKTSSKRRAQNGKITSLHQVSYATSLAVADSSLTLDGETIPNNQLPEKEETETDSKRYLIGSLSLSDGSQHSHDLETRIEELVASLEESKAKAKKFEDEAKVANEKRTKAEEKEAAAQAKATKFKAETRTSKAETERFKAEVQKLQLAKKAFRDIRRAELRKSAQKSWSRLTQIRNEVAHGGNLLGDLYVIQEDLESDPSGGNVLKDGFSNMYKLQHEQIAPHILVISQTTQARILEALNIGANVETLEAWDKYPNRIKKKAKSLILSRMENIRQEYVSWLRSSTRCGFQFRKIENECREVIHTYNEAH
jgi:chromosome segregation ATPase